MAVEYQVKYTPGFDPTIVNVSQNDVGRQFDLKIIDETGAAQQIPSGSTVKFVGMKPSGLGFTVNCTFTNSVVHVTTTDIMTDEHGLIPAEVQITNGNTVIGTANVNLRVEKNPHPEGTIDDNLIRIIPTFEVIYQRLDILESSMYTAENNISNLQTRVGIVEVKADDAYDIGSQAATMASAHAVEIGGIKRGYDGTVYQTAGDAVRAQAFRGTDTTLTVAGKAADAKVVGDDITNLKNASNKMFPVEPVSTTFFENLNYGVPQNVTFYNDRFINSNGTIISQQNTSSIVFNAKPNTTYFFYAPSRNRNIIGETAGDFVVGNTYTVLSQTTPVQYNGIYVLKFTTGASTKKVFVYFYSGAYDYEANKNDIIITETDWQPNVQPTIIDDYIPKREIIVTPKETTFFDGVNYFSDDETAYYTDRFLSNIDGNINSGVSVNSIAFPCEPNTDYYIYIPNNNRGVIGESENNVFSVGTHLDLLWTSGQSAVPYHVTTSADAKYLFIYFYSGTYDYETNKANIVINKNNYYGNITPFIAQEYLPSNLKNTLLNKNVLIFGDSITDTCNFTINSSNQTTAMTWRNPSNSYVNAGGQTIQYNMWPKMLKDLGICAEVRNYARQGASFKDATRPSGEERQNVSYQITVALNDLSNPHDVFDVDDFVPDIVIFALGTNDGTPNDTYDSAMEKTVLKSDGYSVDTTATLANLDMSKFCEAARSAFLRTRIAFPYAQFFCVLPIQRANNEVNGDNLSIYLSKMAKRYGCVIVDGFAESGIIRDTNTWNALGETLKDGLHPNEKGQNMMFRAIYKSLLSHYIDSDVMNN